ncbi:MAG: hypothetical protein RLZZ416_573 [Candidatus Parcubacteria bacterium]|jgi:S1-C subfamily serine protease
MDIEKLSRAQIVLLALLVSFVSSVATGIVTVSLMDQAPPVIAQTVNRVIERTIETVASSTPKSQAAATVITQEKTVVVKEADLITQAVAKATPSLVRIYAPGDEGPVFLSLGVVLGEASVVSDSAGLGDAADVTVELSDGTKARGFVISRDADTGLAYLSSATSTADGKPISWTPIPVSASETPLGESVVMLAGRSKTRIADGLVTSVDDKANVLDTNVDPASLLPGSPLIDTTGSLVGISTFASRAVSSSSFLAALVLTRKDESPKAP